MRTWRYLFIKWIPIENFNANSHLESCTHHGRFETAYKATDDGRHRRYLHVVRSFQHVQRRIFFSGFTLPHIHEAHDTRLSVLTSFFYIFSFSTSCHFCFLTFPIVIPCTTGLSLVVFRFVLRSISYSDKNIIFSSLRWIGLNGMRNSFLFAGWARSSWEFGGCVFGLRVLARTRSFALCAPQTSKPQTNNKTNI